MLPCCHGHIDGLAWNCGSSSVDALELLQSRAGPSVWTHELFYTSAAMFVSMAWGRTVLAPVPMHWSCYGLALGHRYEHTGWFKHLLLCCHVYIRGLVRNCSTSSADALELLQSCAGSSVWVHKLIYTSIAMVILRMAWCGTVVAPVLTHCSLALGHQYEYTSCPIHMLPCSCRWLGEELWWLQCWCTGVAAVLLWAIDMSTQVGLHVCCLVHISVLVRNRGSSSADALELLQSCAGPSMWVHELLCASVVILPFLCWWIGVELC